MWEPWVAVLINLPSFASVRLCLPDELCFAHICFFPVPQPDVLCQCSAVLIKGKFPLGAPLLCVTVDCLIAVFHAKLLCYSLQKQEQPFLFQHSSCRDVLHSSPCPVCQVRLYFCCWQRQLLLCSRCWKFGIFLLIKECVITRAPGVPTAAWEPTSLNSQKQNWPVVEAKKGQLKIQEIAGGYL